MRRRSSRPGEDPPAGAARRGAGPGSGPRGEEESARDLALRLLARPRTEQQLRLALARRGYGEEVRERVLARLRELGLVDDLAYARAYVGEVLSRRPAGAAVLAARLAQRGVSRDHIAQALAEVGAGEALEAARRAARAWLARHPGRADPNHLAAHLARRGFDWDVVREVVEETTGAGAPGASGGVREGGEGDP